MNFAILEKLNICETGNEKKWKLIWEIACESM